MHHKDDSNIVILQYFSISRIPALSSFIPAKEGNLNLLQVTETHASDSSTAVWGDGGWGGVAAAYSRNRIMTMGYRLSMVWPDMALITKLNIPN